MSETSSADAIKDFAALLAPAFGAMAVLTLIYGIYQWIWTNPGEKSAEGSKPPRRKTSKNPFIPGRMSLLESDGSIFKPWSVDSVSSSDQDPDGGRPSLRGWINLLALIGLFQIRKYPRH